MAVNFYGSCSGSSGNKYDIWLNVVQNSQSIEDNTSNVTVKLFLKRNDGYSASAYNLTESSNTAKLIVGGSTKVNKNLSIDTRNSAKVTLATWTGDVSHKDDGSLSLSVSGSFTMGGTSLTGGSVTGAFDCTDIPRASALTLSKTSVNPEETVGAAITAATSSFSHKLKWSLGGSAVTHTLSSGVTSDVFTVPVSWVNEITTAKSGKITVVLTTYNGTKKIGSKSYTLKLVIPSQSAYLPEFSLVSERIDNSVPTDFGEYVKGISQIKLNIEDLKLKYGATVSSYTAKVDTASKSTLPATFDLVKSGEITVSVTVKDSRGLSVKKSTVISVLDYSVPSVTVKSLSRCDEGGQKTTSGTFVLTDLDAKYSSLNGKNIPKITYKYKKADTAAFTGEIEITDTTCILPDGEFLNNSSYTLAFKITDSITTDNEFFEREVSSSAIPFNIRKGGNGASFGCYAESDNELAVAWDLNVKGSLIYENVSPELTSLVKEKRGIARYIPCMELVFIRLRFEIAESLEANENHVIAVFPDKIPTLFTPVTVSINTSINNKGSAAIKSGTGELIVNSEDGISAGDYVYVSGVYFAYRE